MKKLDKFVLLIAAWFGAPGMIFAVTAANDISVENPYALAVPGQPDSPVYMALLNRSDQGRRLVMAESLMSRILELRASNPASGANSVRKLANIDIPRKSLTHLKPGGLHIMLIGLKRELVPGNHITVTLVFGDGSRKDVKVPVQELKQKPKSVLQHSDMMKTHEEQMHQHDKMMK